MTLTEVGTRRAVRDRTAGRYICMFICLYVCMFICLYVYQSVDISISMVVICYASDIKGYDRRTPELSKAPLHMKQDHQYRAIAPPSINI